MCPCRSWQVPHIYRGKLSRVCLRYGVPARILNYGSPDWIRTSNPLVNSEVLYR